MANIFSLISSPFSKPIDWNGIENEAVARRDSRAVAARFSRGNVAIQMGYFVTGTDLEKERAEVAHIKFPD